jgi:hypothetical protein
MSLLVRPNRQSQVLVNFEMAERMYDKNKNFCKNDGYVHFRCVILLHTVLGDVTYIYQL